MLSLKNNSNIKPIGNNIRTYSCGSIIQLGTVGVRQFKTGITRSRRDLNKFLKTQRVVDKWFKIRVNFIICVLVLAKLPDNKDKLITVYNIVKIKAKDDLSTDRIVSF